MHNQELDLNFVKSLSNLKSNEKSIISIYLNTDKRRTDSLEKSRAQIKDFFKELKENADKLGYKEWQLRELEEELLDYLTVHWKTLSNSTIFFLGGDEDIFYVLSLPDRMPNKLYTDDAPYIKPLLEYVENYDKYLVLVLDSKGGQVYLFQAAYLDEIDKVNNEFFDKLEEKKAAILHQKDPQGVFARYINELEELLWDFKEKIDFDRIIVFIPERLKSILEEKISEHFKNITSAIITGNYTKLHKLELLKKIKEVVEEAERQEDLKDVEEIYTNIGNSEYKDGVYGLEATLEHLNAAAVQKILIDEDLSLKGCKSASLGFLFDSCDTCKKQADDCVEVDDLINEIAEKAMETGAIVNFVKDSDKLKEMQGIAAKLRFKL